MQRTPWTERRFHFGIPPGWMPDILERLEGTIARLREMTKQLTDEEAGSASATDGWSIKEHIGHLSDLEDLHEGRIDDFIARKNPLRAADMNNTKTYEAGHNNYSLNELLERFSAKRMIFVNRLRALDDETQMTQALHPRLQENMRPVDMAFFTAEHDDHHLASIRILLAQHH